MLILAYDTTSEYGGAALYRDLDCLAAARSASAATYSVTLFRMVDDLLAQARARQGSSLSLRDVELFAVATGPGSFTGIRVGLAAAQAWAKAFQRPVCGVPVLEAMVEEASPETELATPILDARRGEFYLEISRRRAGEGRSRFVAEGEGLVMKPEGLRPFLERLLQSGAAVTCIVREHDRLAQALRAGLPESIRWAVVRGTLLPAIARLALEAYRRGRVQSPAEINAYYIRRSDAELKWKE
jgi:tRNA threonylcarbamoyladenosine biosynthesis protein TsaB